jgi:hypothetical protein
MKNLGPLLFSLLLLLVLASCQKQIHYTDTDQVPKDSASMATDLPGAAAVDSAAAPAPEVDEQGFAIDQTPATTPAQAPTNTTAPIPYYYPNPCQTTTTVPQRKLPRMCTVCYGTGHCPNCNGSGSYDNPYTGDRMVCCNCNGTGICWHCNGTGQEPEY